MIRKTVLAFGLLTMLFQISLSAAEKSYVVDSAGRKISGVKITADANGNLTLYLDDVARRTFKKGSYRNAYTPKPEDVEKLEKMFEAGRFDLITKYTPSMLEKYGYLGWGDLMSYFLGMVEVDKGNYSEALDIFQRGQAYRGPNQAVLAKGMTLAYIGLEQYDKAQALIDRLIQHTSGELAAFAFNAQGKIMAEKGEKKDAVLEYMKTLLLFKGDSVEDERKNARKQVASLLKDLGDPRHKEFAE